MGRVHVPPLKGLRLMVVEDEFLVAMELERTLEELGATIGAIVGTVDQARKVVPERFDGVLLDVQLGSEFTHDFARDLLAADVPFIFTTGFDAGTLPPGLRTCPRLSKPFSPAQLERMSTEVFLARRDRGGQPRRAKAGRARRTVMRQAPRDDSRR